MRNVTDVLRDITVERVRLNVIQKLIVTVEERVARGGATLLKTVSPNGKTVYTVQIVRSAGKAFNAKLATHMGCVVGGGNAGNW